MFAPRILGNLTAKLRNDDDDDDNVEGDEDGSVELQRLH